MSIDRRLESELARNPQNEEKLIETLEAERKAQLQLFQNLQHQIDLKSHDRTDLTKHYLARDDAFFKQLQILQQLRSSVTFVNDYSQPVAMPAIKAKHTRLHSAIENYDPKNSAYLADFEEFIRDKKAHEAEITKINEWITHTKQEINNLVIPYILYFLLEWMPPLLLIYRYFAPVNALDQAIKQGNVFEAELSALEKRIETEDARFDKKWKTKYAEYSDLRMDEKKLTQLRDEQAQHDQLSNNQKTLDAYIQNCNDPKLAHAFLNFKTHPNHENLFQVCALLCEKKFNDSNQNQDIDRVLEALGHLYPEVQTELKQFTEDTFSNLNARSFYQLLENKYERLINANKNIQAKIKRAKQRILDITTHSASLNAITDAFKLYEYHSEAQKLRAEIEKGREELRKQRTVIEPFKLFLHNRTGENLLHLYQFLSDPAYEEIHSFKKTVQKIYPAALRALQKEQHETISIKISDVIRLQEQFLKQIIAIENTQNPQMKPLKELASSLGTLLNTPDWTWAHFNIIEQHIRKHPEYVQNPTLAGLFSAAMQIVAKSRQFQPVIQPTRPALQTPEIILNQANPLPTFFQPPSKLSSAANDVIKKVMGDMNAYHIQTQDQTLSSEDKQITIDRISNDMLQYIDMLSSDGGAPQTISPQHLALLSDMSLLIRQMTSQTLPHRLNEAGIANASTQLNQLDPDHPIRKGIEFLITLYRSKNEYMAIDTRYAQKQLSKDIRKELQEREKEASRHEEKLLKQKKSHPDALSPEAWRNRHQWTIAHTMQNLIKGYIGRLTQFSSSSNAEESRELQTVASLIHQVYHTLRYEPRHYADIPQLVKQLEHHCTALGEHPVGKATMHLINALQETKDYEAVPAAEESRLRVKK